MNEAESLIKEILDILNEPNETFDGNIYQFKYNGNIKTMADIDLLKTNPSIAIVGVNRIQKYKELFEKLRAILVDKKRISLKVFMDKTQDLIFENKFRLTNIKQIVSNFAGYKATCIRKIYGLSIDGISIKHGKYIFVKKTELWNYIIENGLIENSNPGFFDNFKTSVLNESKITDNFVYVLVNIDTYDSTFAMSIMDEELMDLIYAIRFMAFVTNDRYYIDYKPFSTYILRDIQLSTAGTGGTFQIIRKDLTYPIDDPFFEEKENGNSRIWAIFSNENKSEIEQRTFLAIKWVGKAFDSDDNNIICAEAGFAFETLLYKSEKGIINQSIISNLAESYAFINGKTSDERISLEKEFKDFYTDRSAISHGFLKKPLDKNPFSYCAMLRNTIINLLTIEEFNSLNSSEELAELLQKKKYSVS